MVPPLAGQALGAPEKRAVISAIARIPFPIVISSGNEGVN